ncbi:SpoIIE family protein phosphatase [uncultured Jatrophihabitans sp.]|uniref:SpoIIE family protein phosphatase n=1 Tax=uncultured Jatrophihabitans sp. TaxID=1610747 RepID=UPI0035C947E4
MSAEIAGSPPPASGRDLLALLSTAIASNLDLRTVLQTVTDIGTSISGAQFGAFFYNGRDESGRVYQLHVLSGAGLDTFAAMPEPRITALFEPTFSGTSAVRVDDVTADPRFSGMPPGHLPVRSYLAVPVVTRTGEVIGALLFGHQDVGNFDTETERTLHVVAAQAAVAVENARLFAAEQAARRRAEDATARLALLQHLAGRLAGALTADETVSAAAEILVDPVGATRVGVFVRDGVGYRHVSQVSGRGPTTPALTFLPDDLPNPVQTAVRSGLDHLRLVRLQLMTDYPELCEAIGDVPATTILLPLTVGHQKVGACTFTWHDSSPDMGPADLEMLRAAAAQISSALDRARLFDAERAARADLADSIRAATETSRALQRALLARRLPEVAGLDVAVRYQASDVDAEVGGDWYDIVPREHGAVLVIGDVQGHNLAAAALMGQLRTGLHAYLAEGHAVELAVRRANHLMTQLTDDMLATCCLVDVDLSARQLRMVSAGHPKAVCLNGGRTMTVLPDRTGLPLGAVPDSTWPVTTAPLGDADRIVLYTDGLIERRGVDLYAEIARLGALCGTLGTVGAEEAALRLVDEMGVAAEDDLALLVCDLRPTGDAERTRTFTVNAATNVSVVRRQARQTLASWQLDGLDYTATLVVSELVTNIVRYARSGGWLQLQQLGDGVRIVARDDSESLPDFDLDPDDDETHGRGLMLVRAVADQWGVQLESDGKTIWVELRTEQTNLIPYAAEQSAS